MLLEWIPNDVNNEVCDVPPRGLKSCQVTNEGRARDREADHRKRSYTLRHCGLADLSWRSPSGAVEIWLAPIAQICCTKEGSEHILSNRTWKDNILVKPAPEATIF